MKQIYTTWDESLEEIEKDINKNIKENNWDVSNIKYKLDTRDDCTYHYAMVIYDV